jgi:cyclophilin family peptidyl-prolyl cis-trans isomerase/protein-disulfide isomerase
LVVFSLFPVKRKDEEIMMIKKYLYTLPLLAMILLSACSGQATIPAATGAAATTAATSSPAAAAVTTATIELTQSATEEATSEPTLTPVPTLPISTAPAACKAVESVISAKVPDEYKTTIPVADEKNDWIMGSKKPVMTLIEYSDFQCPYCQLMSASVNTFMKAHGDEVQLVYRDFPLSIHDKSLIAAQAAEAAGLQGKFWEMHDYLFDSSNWKNWTAMEKDAFETWLKGTAAPAISGLDTTKFATDLTSKEIVAKVNAQLASVEKLAEEQKNNLGGTPTFYLDYGGSVQAINPSPVLFENIINLIKQNDKLYKECPPQTIDTKKQYTATIKTEKGDIVIKLFPDKAPTTVNSFVFLAKKGYYNGVTFFRVVSDFVAQTGDASNSGMGNAGYEFDTEIAEGLNYDKEGMVGMARLSTTTFSNGSQFFITMAPVSSLNRLYTIFGEVTSGMDVVKKLTPRDVSRDTSPADGDKIISVTIEEK